MTDVAASEGLLPNGETLEFSACELSIVIVVKGAHRLIAVFPEHPECHVTEQLQREKVKLTVVVIGNSVSVTGEATLKNIATQTGGEF